MTRLALVAIAAATLGLTACNKPAATDTTAAQDIGEADMMADNAVSLAEAAMDNAAMTDSGATDSGVTEERMENASAPADKASEKIGDAKDKVDAAN